MRALGKAKLKSFSLKGNELNESEKFFAKNIKAEMSILYNQWDTSTEEILHKLKREQDGNNTEPLQSGG